MESIFSVLTILAMLYFISEVKDRRTSRTCERPEIDKEKKTPDFLIKKEKGEKIIND